MNKNLISLLAVLGIVSAASTGCEDEAASALKSFAPLDKKDQSEIVCLYDFETPGKVPAPYKIVKGEGMTGGGGLVLERPKPIENYSFFSKDIKGLEPGKFYKLTAMVRVRGLRTVSAQPWLGGAGQLVNGKMDLAGFDFSGGGKYLTSNYIRFRVKDGESDWQTASVLFMMRP